MLTLRPINMVSPHFFFIFGKIFWANTFGSQTTKLILMFVDGQVYHNYIFLPLCLVQYDYNYNIMQLFPLTGK